MKNKSIQPILENLQFQRRESFNIPLYASETKSIEFPAIAFSLNSDYNSPILVENTEDVGLTGGELVRTTFDNLRQLPLTWTTQMLNNALLLCSEGAWASEKILDTAFLVEASQLLKSERILVAIPKRGMILATAYTRTEAVIAFGSYMLEFYEDMSSLPLSDKLFIIEEGKISGFITIKPKETPSQNATKDSLILKVKNEISTKIVRKSDIHGLESYLVTLGTQDFNDFANVSYQIIVNILNKNTDNPKFNGLIEFNILSEWLPKSPDFEKTLTAFLERLKRKSNLTNAAYLLKKDIAITFAHLSDVEMDVQQPKRGLTIAYH